MKKLVWDTLQPHFEHHHLRWEDEMNYLFEIRRNYVDDGICGRVLGRDLFDNWVVLTEEELTWALANPEAFWMSVAL